jgi:hypothetical protein
VDHQFHGPWNAEIAWGLKDDAVGLWGAVTGVEEGEVSEGVLIRSEGVMGQSDDDGEHPLIC